MSKYKNKEISLKGKKYILCGEIGNGGNGCICSAKVEGESQLYAVKFLKNDNKEKKERFKREIEFCEKNEHPNIVKVFAHGEFENELYYIMPQYSKTLRNVIEIENDPLNLLNYILQLCEGIKFVHDKKMIHRDIKPENILVDDNQNLVLADFGIVHFQDSILTKRNDWLGNKGYAAPEQLLKGHTNDITNACDIYAIGMIINELFTKEKPLGSQFITISDVNPALYSLDSLVCACRAQNPEERPSIDEIILQIQLIKGRFQEDLSKIKEYLLQDEDVDLSKENINEIVEKASKDILSAKFVFENISDENLKKYNHNYHMDIHYKIDNILKSMYFQELLYQECLKKFNYEAGVYTRGEKYLPLDLNKEEDSCKYKKLQEILKKYGLCKDKNLRGKILKIFASCCDYHCDEILREMQSLEKSVQDLEDAPIFYIVQKLRAVFNESGVKKIDLIEHILVNWDMTNYNDNLGKSLYKLENREEQDILLKFQKEWGIVYGKIDSCYYSVKFKSKDSYNKFKKFALELAKPHYEFEGDVLDFIRIKQEYAGVVELFPLDSFKITNVLAKILGIRSDY